MTKLYTLIPDPRRSTIRPGEEIRFLLVRNNDAYPEPRDIKWGASTPDGPTVYAMRETSDQARLTDTFETEGEYTVSVSFRVGSSTYTKEHSFRVEQPVPGRLQDMLRITTDPPMTTIVPNQKMNFKLEKTGEIEGIRSVSDLQPRWFCYNDMEHASLLAPKIYRGDRGPEWRGEDWDFVGEHRVVCAVTYQRKDYHLELPVTVISNETMAKTAPIVSAHPNNPVVALNAGISAYNTILKFEEEKPAPPEKQAAYKKRMKQQNDYLARLEGLLETSKNETRVPISTLYHSRYNPRIKETHSQWMPLNVFVSYDSSGQFRLVDWTNPSSERSQGDYDGWSAGVVWNRHRSTSEVLSAWDWHNQYPDGIIKFRYAENGNRPVAMNVGGEMDGNSPVLPSQLTEVEGDFETDGSSAADEASAVLDYIGVL